jgi:hypothetical protein|tara:strand:- start:392 stop:1618 length:1227 start_codon:yes stop_codon:yes gene_type:complete
MVFRYLNRPRGGSSSSAFYDFSLGSLPAGVTLTRASAGYRRNSSGVLVSETTDAARFQYRYNGSAWVADGLLVEEAATNIATYSEEFSNAVWLKFNTTVTANAATAPDGTATADAVVENSATTSHSVYRVPTFTSGTTCVASIYAKADTRTWVVIYLDTARFGGTGNTYFNLATGVVGTVLAGATAHITQEANGFYRCSVIATPTSSGGGTFAYGLASGDTAASYTGDGVSQAYIWGATLVEKPAISSYIQTVASTVARAADVALITNANAISDQCWIVKARTARKLSTYSTVLFQVDDGTNSNRRFAVHVNGNVYVYSVVAGVTQAALNVGAVALDTDFTLACRFADNNFAASVNGGAIVTDVSGTNPVGLTTARVGNLNTNAWCCTIKTIETRRTATDAELPLLAA